MSGSPQTGQEAGSPATEDTGELTISQAIRMSVQDTEVRGLRRRSITAISALVAVVLVAQAAVLLVFGYRYLRAETEQQARAYATLAAAPVCGAFEDYFDSGFSKFRELVQEVAGLNRDLERFELYDVEGRLLVRSDELESSARGASPRAEEVLDERQLEAIRGLSLEAWSETGGDGVRRYVVVAPHVEEWGRHRYSVLFRFSYRGLAAAMWKAGWQIAGLALLALALGVVFAYLLSAQSLVPVARLTHGARRLAEGDLDHRIGLATGDEFETLSATLDQMAGRLASTVKDLETSNERLNRLNAELQQLDRVKSDLLANVSHELRTPLTAISGYVEALQVGILGELDEVQGRSLAVVGRNVKRLRSMIDQLLSYSRMESGRLEVELAAFDLEAVASHVVEAVAAAHGGELNLRFDCPPDLPEVYGDGVRIGQVIENLITNAVKFSPEGGAVDLRLREAGDGVRVEVADRGIGIPEDLQEKIFDRFYQIDSSARRHFGGMGLGLAIVREILERNHSRIEVESRSGEGSTFRFSLPLAVERTGLHATAGGRRVAIVDDDAGFVQQVASHLASRGFVVDTAATAEHGFQMIQRTRPRAIVLDRILPDLDGFDLLQRLRRHARTRDVPVILASVRRENALAMRLGAAACLRKPIDLAELEKILAEVMGG